MHQLKTGAAILLSVPSNIALCHVSEFKDSPNLVHYLTILETTF